MIKKNLLILLCLALVGYWSQQPAEAGPIKRSIVRTIKWGLCVPATCVTFCHAILPSLAFHACSVSIGACDLVIEHDLKKEEAAKAEAQAETEKKGD